MKTKLLPLVILSAALAPFAQAQEVSPTPEDQISLRGAEPSLRSDPSVPVPVETTKEYPRPGTPLANPKPKASPMKDAPPSPTPTPRVTRTAKPAKPQPTKSPAANATAKAKPKAASTTAKTTKPKAASPPAAASVKKAKPQPVASAPAKMKKELPTTARGMENEWAAAISKHDTATIQTLLASDYVGVTATGNVVNKAGLIAELKKDKTEYDSVTNSGLVVREHGDAAVVVGTTTQKGKDAAGKSFSYTYRWTDTWMKRDGQWQCVASQSIRWRG